MIKKILTICFAVMLSLTGAVAQTNTFPGSGNVGIGIASPTVNLVVTGGTDATPTTGGYLLIGSTTGTNMIFDDNEIMGRNNGAISPLYLQNEGGDLVIHNASSLGRSRVIIKDNGNIGIGTVAPTPTESLSIYAPDGTNNIGIYRASTGQLTHLLFENGGDYGAIGLYSAGTRNVQISAKSRSYAYFNSGNVLIGKNSQANSSYKLDVNGNIRANEVIVNTTGADYVFNPSYHLSSLDSLKTYIHTYHHLPDVSSADEMSKGGMDIGRIQTLLLQKLEEMTLYMIAQDSVNRQQALEISSFKRTLKSLRKTVTHK